MDENYLQKLNSFPNPTDLNFKVLLEMFQDRKYKIESVEEPNKIILTRVGNKKIYCFLPMEKKTNIGMMKEYMIYMHKNHAQWVIIVYGNEITPSAKKICKIQKNMSIQLFSTDEFTTNITKNCTSCKHSKLVGNKKKEIVSLYGEDLPELLDTDAVSKYYWYQPGDIIEIIRDGCEVYYRKVISAQ